MKDTLLTNTIRNATEIAANTETDLANPFNYWFWIAIVELFIIMYLIFFKKNKINISVREQFKQEAKKGDIDFGNIINSSFHVKPLYDELKVKCHPDRFPNDEKKNKIALNLFQEISKNKTDYKKLIELKNISIDKLNINF